LGKTGKIGLGIGIAGGGVILLLIFGFYSFESETSESILSPLPFDETSESILPPSLPFDETLTSEYDDIVNNIEKYKGKTFTFEGKIINIDRFSVQEVGGFSFYPYEFQVDAGSGNIYVVLYSEDDYSAGEKLSVGDEVEVTGTIITIEHLDVDLEAGESTPVPRVGGEQINCISC